MAELAPEGVATAGSREGAEPSGPARPDEVARQVRGSSLLVLGRGISLLSNLIVQVLLVRALSKADYGVFAYVLSLITMLATLVTFGLDRGLARFLAVYREREETSKLWGVITLQLVTILGLGSALAVVVVVFRGWLGDSVFDDPEIATLLAVMVLVAPVQALDGMVAAIFAAFGESRAIFVRRYLLDPLLRLSVVGILLLTQQSLLFVGAGYVVAALFGLAVYGHLLVRMFTKHGLVGESGPSGAGVSLPVREVASFSVPLLATDAMFIVLGTSDVVILGRVAGPTAVASYRAVLPLARLNQLVMNSFTLLFGPLMARLWARGDREGLRRAYWETSGWVAVATFPVFALTLGLAGPLTSTLFGDQYASSAIYLQILAVGFYFNAILGFNGVTLKMVGAVWLVARIAVLALAVNLAANLVLIPRYGALGAAIGTSFSVCFYNLAKQWGLRRGTGISLFDVRYGPLYGVVALATVAMVAADRTFGSSLPIQVAVVALGCAAVLAAGRRTLGVATTFPELARVPVLGNWLLSSGSGR